MVPSMSPAVVKSAQRSFAVFEIFDRARRPLALKAVCEELGCPVSSGAALLKSLVTLGYLDYDRDQRTYFPTMRISILGRWVEGAMFGEGHILRLMEDLQAAIDETTIMLATQSDVHAQYVHVLMRGEPLQFNTPPGTLRPLARSGVGLMLLSARTDAEIERLCRRINVEVRGGERVDFGQVMETVRRARDEGYVFAKNMAMPQGSVIALLLPRGPFGKQFALGIGGGTARLERDTDAILQEARARIDRLKEIVTA